MWQQLWAGIPWRVLVNIVVCALLGRFAVRPLLVAYAPNLCRTRFAPYFVIPIGVFLLTALSLAFLNEAIAEFLAMVGSCSMVPAVAALLIDAFFARQEEPSSVSDLQIR